MPVVVFMYVRYTFLCKSINKTVRTRGVSDIARVFFRIVFELKMILENIHIHKAFFKVQTRLSNKTTNAPNMFSLYTICVCSFIYCAVFGELFLGFRGAIIKRKPCVLCVCAALSCVQSDKTLKKKQYKHIFNRKFGKVSVEPQKFTTGMHSLYRKAYKFR